VTVTYFTPPPGGRTTAGSNAPGAFLVLQIERVVEEETEGSTSASFKENKNPISPATGDEEKKETNQEEAVKITADTVVYSQRLLQKKEALLKRISKLQKQCKE